MKVLEPIVKDVSQKEPETSAEDIKKTENLFDRTDAETPLEGAPEKTRADRLAGFDGDVYSKEELVITPQEKKDFIDALVSGERYLQAYDIFGGAVHLVIRNRTSSETQAMYAYMRHELSRPGKFAGTLDGDMSYIILVAQVEELNGTKFPVMKAPLAFTEEDGQEKAPGWMPSLNAWKEKNEALVNAIIRQVQLFEYKYWSMVREASNKNFWKSDTSIGG